MFQSSRRRFLAGFAMLGVGGAMLGGRALAQTANMLRCEGPIASKAVTGLKPTSANGGVFQNLSYGKINPDALAFGYRNEFRIPGKVGKLAKGVSLYPGGTTTANINLVASRGDARGSEALYLTIELPAFILDQALLASVQQNRATLSIAALKGIAISPEFQINRAYSTISPKLNSSFYSSFQQIKTKLPKGTDFSVKVMVEGKQVAVVTFPKLALAKIVDALEVEQGRRAADIAKNPGLTGDLTYATLPYGCTITKPSSSGSGSSGCYLTTAAVDVVGLPDDCWELRQLRAFRDRFAQSGGEASAMMADYYAHAPAVVDGINARADAQRVWLKAYWLGIVPSAIASRLRLDGIARSIYVGWTRKLQHLAS